MMSWIMDTPVSVIPRGESVRRISASCFSTIAVLLGVIARATARAAGQPRSEARRRQHSPASTVKTICPAAAARMRPPALTSKSGESSSPTAKSSRIKPNSANCTTASCVNSLSPDGPIRMPQMRNPTIEGPRNRRNNHATTSAVPNIATICARRETSCMARMVFQPRRGGQKRPAGERLSSRWCEKILSRTRGNHFSPPHHPPMP